MIPSVDASLPEAKDFFENISSYTIYTDKVYTPVTALTATATVNGKTYTYSQYAENDATAYYLARTYGEPYSSFSASNISFETFFSSPEKVSIPSTYKQKYTLPYASATVLATDGLNNRANVTNSKQTYSDVRYYYIPQGSVVVTYVDTEGNTLKTSLNLVENQDVGSVTDNVVTYNTYDATGEANAPTTITTTDGKT